MNRDETSTPRAANRHRRRAFRSASIVACLGILIAVQPSTSGRADDGKPSPAVANSNAAGDPAAAGTFDLRVVGPDGKPIPNVEADFLSEPRIQAEQVRRGKFASRASYGATLQADGEGRLVVSRPADWQRLEICIDALGYARYWHAWRPYLRSDPIPAELTVKLEAGWSVGGTIVDGDGKPVSGARILAPNDSVLGSVDVSKRYLDTRPTSDEEGRWHFDSVPLWRDPVTVEIDHPQFLARGAKLKRAEFGIKPGQGQKPSAKIVLSPGLTITGRVTDKSGTAIAGALVQTSSGRFYRTAVTERDGLYKLAGCESGPHEVVASASGFAPVLRSVRIQPELAPVEFQLGIGGTLRLRALDAHGKPVPKARVYCSPFAYYDIPGPNLETDLQGVWEWKRAPLEKSWALVTLPDGRPLSGQSVSPRPEEYVFRVPPELIVSGTVVDAQSKQPIERFRVVPGGNWAPSRWLWADSFDATGGSYWIRRRNELDFQVRIESDGYLPAESGRIAEQAGRVTVDFALTKGDDIVGNVVTAEGKPAAYAKVAMVMGGRQVYISNGDLQDYPLTARRVADDLGHFRFPREKTHGWLVATHPSGYAEVKCATASNPKDIRLTPWARLEGTYLVAGKPQPSESISVSGPFGAQPEKAPNVSWFFSATTDFQGRYVFDRVLPGPRVIRRLVEMFDENGPTGQTLATHNMTVRLEAGKTTHFDLGGSGRPVIGQLRWSPDAIRTAPWKQVLIGARSRESGLNDSNLSFTVTPDANGNFSIDGVPAGDYELSVRLLSGSNAIQLKHKFNVPEVDKKLSQRPVDLGVLTLGGKKETTNVEP